MARREYTDDEKAEALAVLASCGGNVTQAAKETGVNRVTLLTWSKGRGVNAGTVTSVTHKKGELVGLLREKAWMLAGQLTEAKAKEATLSQIATAFGIVTDKIVLLEDIAAERALIDAEIAKTNEAKESGGDTAAIEPAERQGPQILKERYEDNTSTSFSPGADED